MIESNRNASQAQLNEHIKAMGANVKYSHQLTPQLWIWEENFKVRVPHQILQLIVSWTSEVYP